MDLYREDILEHYENPRNLGEFDTLLGGKNILEGRESNASCGDMIQFQIKIEAGRVKETKWKGAGCAISTAAASKLSEWLQGKELLTLQKMSEKEIWLKGVGIEVNLGREKCLMLPVRIVKKLLVKVEVW